MGLKKLKKIRGPAEKDPGLVRDVPEKVILKHG
jgi:hypothetical protein